MSAFFTTPSMFTGIIKQLGTITSMDRHGDDMRLCVEIHPVPEVDIGASVSNSGVCLTVVETSNSRLSFDVMTQTVKLTSLANKNVGDQLNIETSLRVGDEMGGHFVYGHVDGVAHVTQIQQKGDSVVMTIQPPEHLMRYLAPQGSVAIDGVSLTVADQREHDFDVSLIDHTMKVTTLGRLTVGAAVNIEVDMMMKYLDRLTNAKPV
ncbi:riboflavin synthase [Candidatus Uhrbacteria bacterium CG10_big_fil_rev_8_21_14_0_10_50_16]|uniref:Riboflavin synthase n=1 Tax=Candidatus Uhrbacteria bacterium CG10_big_fil_rev_8_21_14_0_10_50_16 TaxID=1975039 RepID=A0A2H0RND9_9BACT|nr:MAG: riboflavin synthase [Candidatus Uhrbacteria bacterium CG10_big_fil_rev_8_21_14_0_10_50_16]